VLVLKFASFRVVRRSELQSQKSTPENKGLLVSLSILKFAKARHKHWRTSESGH